MTAEEMWQAYKTINADIGDELDAWAFGVEPDHLADLVLRGVKTGTASAYPLYAHYGEDLPEADQYDVILDGQGQAVCVIKTTKVYVTPFNEVTAEHAFEEGEGDRSLTYWRQVHEEVFSQWLEEAGLTFSEDMLVVCEEFEVVYPLST